MELSGGRWAARLSKHNMIFHLFLR
jgi:hypothetical protein